MVQTLCDLKKCLLLETLNTKLMRGLVILIGKTKVLCLSTAKELENGLKNTNPLHLLQMCYTCCYTSTPRLCWVVTLVTLKNKVCV